MSKDTIQQFFDLLDDYLIGDLEVMVNEVPARPSGGLGYPSIQIILSGMELLGRVLSGGKEDVEAFNHFWDYFFIKDNPCYNNSRLKKIFRNSIRNGTAHYFLAKFGIQLSKGDDCNLTRTSNGELNIDIVTFYKDFLKSYSRIKAELMASSESGDLVNNFEVGYMNLVKDLRAAKMDIDSYIKDLPVFPQESFISPSGTKIGEACHTSSSHMVTRLPGDRLSK
jgi:hypothetical protein